MSNVIAFTPKAPPTGAPDLVMGIADLRSIIVVIRPRVERARSLDTLLRHYASWLRAYHERSGAIKQAFLFPEKEISIYGKEAEEDALDDVTNHMADAEDLIRGPHPWLSLPAFQRTKAACIRLLDSCDWSLGQAESAARSMAPQPPRGDAA